jgi:S1-C subfamily serine protease
MSALLSFSDELAAAVERAARAVVTVKARPRIASTGVHWRPGVVVTAEHTVRVDEDITVVRPDGRTMRATLAGRDPGTDLAVLRVADADFPVADVGDPAALKVGHLVLALGYGPRASWGVVSALGGRWRTWRGGEIDQLLRLDATLYPGFSGGPVVDAGGRVVAIATSGLSRRLELAIPASTVERITGELLERGRVSRGYLGVGLHPVRLPSSATRALGRPVEIGLIVTNLEPDGPAMQAGLLLGDILVAIDAQSVDAPDDVQSMIAARRPGSTLAATILRAGVATELRLTVGERPSRGR